MDVKGAFLYGKINEEVFLKPPEGVTVPTGHVLKLAKSLYGLRKSPKSWYECFTDFKDQKTITVCITKGTYIYCYMSTIY